MTKLYAKCFKGSAYVAAPQIYLGNTTGHTEIIAFTATLKSDLWIFGAYNTVQSLISLGICQRCKLLCHSISAVVIENVS